MHSVVTEQHAIARPRVEARHHRAADHDDGDAFELARTRQLDGTQPEWARYADHWRADHWRSERLNEAEDALTDRWVGAGGRC